MIGALVLRPEPGATVTAAALAAGGLDVIRQPLFTVSAIDWTSPNPADFDAIVLTSGNAARHAGPGLASLAHVPVVAVGASTADAAEAAGLSVVLTGEGDAAALVTVARDRGFARLLHLAGRDHIAILGVETIAVYASEPLPVAAGSRRAWKGRLALLHSIRAARRFAELVDRDGVARADIAVAALSPAVLAAAGGGWRRAEAAVVPTDRALVALAAAIIDPPARAGDNRPR